MLKLFPLSILPLLIQRVYLAPAEATGTGMRSEREQLIKSSSSHNAESEFCLPSAAISFYPRVMSYGTFALGNTMSSIIMLHLLPNQGQVISASFYLHNQSNWLHSWERENRQRTYKTIATNIFYGPQHSGKTEMIASFWSTFEDLM